MVSGKSLSTQYTNAFLRKIKLGNDLSLQEINAFTKGITDFLREIHGIEVRKDLVRFPKVMIDINEFFKKINGLLKEIKLGIGRYKTPSNRSKSSLCSLIVLADVLWIQLGGASAIVSNHGGRVITDRKHVVCFFDCLDSLSKSSFGRT